MNKPYMLTLQGGFWKMEKLVKPLRALKTSGFNFGKSDHFTNRKSFLEKFDNRIKVGRGAKKNL